MGEVPRNPPILNPPIRLAVCVSGEGTTLQNLIDQIRSRRLRAEIVHVIASRPRIGAIARAEAAQIPWPWRTQRPIQDRVQRSVFEPIRHSSRLGDPGRLPLAAQYSGRYRGECSIHPAVRLLRRGLLRLQGSQGRPRRGRESQRLHVHFADDAYDTGPIILQRGVPCRMTTQSRLSPLASSRRNARRCRKPSRSMPKAAQGRRPSRPHRAAGLMVLRAGVGRARAADGSRLANGSACRTPMKCPQ